MSFLENRRQQPGPSFLPRRLRVRTLASRLLIALVPALVMLLAVTGYLTYRLSADFISIALHRNVRLQNLGQANAIERYLNESKNALLVLAMHTPDPERMRNFLQRETLVSGRNFPFLGFISVHNDTHFLFVQHNKKIIQLDPTAIDRCRPDLFSLFEKIKELPENTAWLSPMAHAYYPFPTDQNRHNRLAMHVLQLAAPVHEQGRLIGYLLLALQAKDIRNILSLYNSNDSPLWAFARSPEMRFSFLFNTDGWILFQSEKIQNQDKNLGTYLIRSQCEGTMGLPELQSAFRPGSDCQQFWTMVAEIREGKQGLLEVSDSKSKDFPTKEHSMAYAPVRFTPGFHGQGNVVFGIAFEDRSRLTMVAGYKQVDVMFIITVASGVLATLMIFLLSRFVTRPLKQLALALLSVRDSGRLDPIEIRNGSYEIALVQDAVNGMLQTMRSQLQEIQIRDRRIHLENLREPIEEDVEPLAVASSLAADSVPRIIGFGQKMDTLREEILKAAKVDVDVLIVGETGTGKQLTAEAIHTCSNRKDSPMISINCGELDENLLMDTLFGHVKGAYTEAKADRKGSFLEANGGTLFLDEIQVASPRVQQALLRAIALRKIKPLGSDLELDVNVRVIAATNIDLQHLVEARIFREDLYFRLKVITIHTPPLRNHKENLLLLAMHYLHEGEELTGKSGLKLSKGALERMKGYNWPGNIRELRNCVTRAAVMTENQVIQADELHLDNVEKHNDDDAGARGLEHPEMTGLLEESSAPKETPDKPIRSETAPDTLTDGKSKKQTPVAADYKELLNPRQRKAWPEIVSKGRITRGEYEQLMESKVSARTANNDLQDMVAQGLLRKEGHGPATCYVIANPNLV